MKKLSNFITLIIILPTLKSIRTSVVLLMLLLPAALYSQSRITQAKFDSSYEQALDALSNDTAAVTNYLQRFSAAVEFLTNIQRAKLAYLQLKIRERISPGSAAGGMVLLPSPAMFKNTDSLELYAARYLERSMPDRAIALLMKELEILPENSGAADRAKLGLCEAYRQKQEYSKGVNLIYSLMERPSPFTLQNLAYAYSRLAALYNEWGEPPASHCDSVFEYSLLCQEVAQRAGDIPTLAASRNELSFQYRQKGDYDKALELSKRSVSGFLSAHMPFQAMNALINQSNIFLGKKEYRDALVALEEATRLAPIWENRNLYMRIYQQYATIYKILGQYQEACGFLTLYNHLQVDFFSDRINSQINEQSARYDLIIKEQQIRQEQKKNEFKQRQIIFLAIILVTLTIAFVFSLFYFRLRRKGALRLKLAEAVQDSETNERRRIARDLHDGLGPVLSAINHYFQAFLDAKPETREDIRNRLQLVISEAIDEVSRISHNISPHVLEKHGLATALNNLIAPLTANGSYEISFNFRCEEKLDPKVELTIYRCITELLNNTMKHAGASGITLDIRRQGDRMLIAYTDNGTGFNPSSAKKTGMGLHNIKNRVESFGGSLVLSSSPGSGTSVSISIPL